VDLNSQNFTFNSILPGSMTSEVSANFLLRSQRFHGRLWRIRKRMKKAKALKTREPDNPKNQAMKMITKNVSFEHHGKKIVFM